MSCAGEKVWSAASHRYKEFHHAAALAALDDPQLDTQHMVSFLKSFNVLRVGSAAVTGILHSSQAEMSLLIGVMLTACAIDAVLARYVSSRGLNILRRNVTKLAYATLCLHFVL